MLKTGLRVAILLLAIGGHGRDTGHRRPPHRHRPHAPVSIDGFLAGNAEGQSSVSATGLAYLPFTTQSINFNGTSQGLNLGSLPAFNGATVVTCAFNFRYNLTGWPTGTQTLFGNGQTNNQVFVIEIAPNGGSGQAAVRVASAANTYQSAFVPDNTYYGQYMHHAIVAVNLNTSTVRWFADGRPVTLGGTPTWPSSFRTAAFAWTMGYRNVTTPTQRFRGQMSNLACWVGWEPSTQEAQEGIWAEGEAVDMRTRDAFNVPDPTYYWPDLAQSEVMGAGSAPVGASSPTASTIVSTDRVYSDGIFERRFVIFDGLEPWLGTFYGNAGNYSATAAVWYDSGGNLRLAYNRGLGHTDGGTGRTTQSWDDGLTFPIGERPWPMDSHATTTAAWPRPTLHGDTTPNLRNFNIVMYPGIGAAGADRWFAVTNHNAGTFVVDPAEPDITRRLWIWQSDDNLANFTWEEFYGPGLNDPNSAVRLNWTSVGKARVVQLPDDSLVFAFYYRTVAAGANYRIALARSTDNGDTFTYVRDIASTVGVDYEEPYLIVDPNTNELVVFARIDQDHSIRRSAIDADTPTVAWPTPSIVTYSWHNPCVLYRATDGLMILQGRNWESFDESGNLAWSAVRVSNDFGLTWSRQVKITNWTQRSAQGDFWELPDHRIGTVFSNDRDDAPTVRTWMEAAIFRESFLTMLRSEPHSNDP